MNKDKQGWPDVKNTPEPANPETQQRTKMPTYENDELSLLECIGEVYQQQNSDRQYELVDMDHDMSRSLPSDSHDTDISPVFAKVAPEPRLWTNPDDKLNESEADKYDDVQLSLSNMPLLDPEQRKPSAYPLIVGRIAQQTSQQENTTLKYWRDNYDPIFLHQIDSKMVEYNSNNDAQQAISQYHAMDIKGRRISMYKRQVMTKNDKIQTVGELDRLELLNSREDRWPCLIFRKHVERITMLINMFALNIIKRKSFEAVTIIVIIANCATLTMSQADKEPTDTENLVENIFQALYTIEMVLKILGLGFIFNKGAYMRDYFNALDFLIVMSAYVSMIESGDDGSSTDGVSLKSLRAFRVLKPLRAVNNIPGLRLIVQAIMSALPLLKDTIIVLLFFFLIFAIGGVNLFSGMLRQRCVHIETGSVQLDESGEELLCGSDDPCQDEYFCGKRNLNPNYDVTSFDNIFWALLAIFQCVTLEGWSDIMVLYQRVYTYYAFLFFLPLVFVGAFFLLNLTLAVINTSFNDAQERIKQNKADAEAELQKLFSDKPGSEDFEEKRELPAQGQNNMGIHQYFIAKRAAQRLRAFAQNYHKEENYQREEISRTHQQKYPIQKQQDAHVKVETVEPKESSQKPTSQETLVVTLLRRTDEISAKQEEEDHVNSLDHLLPYKRALSTLVHQPDILSMQGSRNDQSMQLRVRAQSNSFTLKSRSQRESKDASNHQNMVIEEEEQSEPEQSNRSVSEFLQGLKNQEDEMEAALALANGDTVSQNNQNCFDQVLATSSLLPHAYKTAGFTGQKIPSTRKSDQNNMIMAFNDLRRADGLGLVANSSTYQTAMASKIQQNNQDLQKGNKRQTSLIKDIKSQMLQKRLEEELDFDRMMNPRTRLGWQEENSAVSIQRDKADESYKMSFIMDSHSDGHETADPAVSMNYLKPQRPVVSQLDDAAAWTGQEVEEDVPQDSGTRSLASSVISSTSSIKWELYRYAHEKSRIDHDKMRDSRAIAKTGNLSREVNPNIFRWLTSTEKKSTSVFFANNEKEINQKDITIFKQGSSQSGMKQQMDVFSNLNVPVRPEQFASIQKRNSIVDVPKSQQSMYKSKAKAQAIAQKKLQIAEIYKTMKGKQFDANKARDLYASVNTKQQKIMINPGVPYRSSSMGDVFERRYKLKYNQRLKGLNKFIIFRGEEQGSKDLCDDMFESDSYFEKHMQPWQLKNKLKIHDVDEIKFDDDDEDALVLQQQPYETVMSISQSDMLSHLPTKLLSRRSDIIVSSTLSMSLHPQDEFVPQSFALLTQHSIQRRVRDRSDFRSMSIHHAQLIQPDNFVRRSPQGKQKQEKVFSDDDSEEYLLDVTKMKNMKTGHFSFIPHSGHHGVEGSLQNTDAPGAQNQYQFQLPKTLLSEPLRPTLASQLSPPDKRNYNIQKSKYESQQRFMATMMVPASQKVFKEDELASMVAGDYWSDSDSDDDDDDEPIDRNQGSGDAAQSKDNVQVNLLQRQGLDKQISLAQFDEAVKKVVDKQDNSRTGKKIEQLMEKGHIPDQIRNEFNLPQDMQNRDVDFREVRKMDSLMPIKHPEWSGQDVLQTSMNKEQSIWVVDKIRSVRVWPKGPQGIICKMRAILKMHCTSMLFDQFMIICVLLNTIVMAMDRYGIDPHTEKVLNNLNLAFTYIFIYEMTVKLLAIGPKKYTASKWNLIDGAVVLLSVIEIIVESQATNQKSGSGLSAFRSVKVFRTFRVIRVARILRALHSMQVIIGVISRSFRSFMYVILLLILFVFIYALIGVQIYQGKFDFGPDEDLPAGHYETFDIAFVTTFQVLTMENWQTVMYDSMRSARGSVFLKTLTVIYYISWIFIGNFILLNLFLAILIDSFTNEDSETNASEQEYLEAEEKAAEIRYQRLEELKAKRRIKLKAVSLKSSRLGQSKLGASTNLQKKVNFTGNAAFKDFELVEDLDDLDQTSIHNMLVATKVIQDKSSNKKDWVIPDNIEAQNSIYLFNRHGLFRRTCYYTQHHRYFDRFIMLLIALSSSQLAFETYIQDLDKEDTVMTTNSFIGQIFTYLFLLEFIIKLIALGFIMDRDSYLRESWNQLDFFIVTTGLIDNILSNQDVTAFRILRLLRMLRPLRVVSHNLQMKMIVSALLDAGGSILNVIVVILMVWIMFAIFAVNTYKGHFFYCTIDKYDNKDQYECENNGGEWLRYDSNFDDVSQAMTTLFIVSSLEGWPGIMHQAMDITKVGNGPKFQNNVKHSIFFIIFVLIGSFFFLNFFIGVLFLKYAEAQKRETAGFTQEQLVWSEMQVMILNAQLPINATDKPRDRYKWRLKTFYVVTASYFELGIIVIIILNMLQMAMTFEDQSTSMKHVMDFANYIFTITFILEACLKLFAFRLAYFKTAWNKFDFFVVISSILDFMLSALQDTTVEASGKQDQQEQSALSVAPQLARVLRVLRVSRVLRIANHHKGLQQLFNTIMLSVSGLLNVFMLLMLFFFILAVLGQFMFSQVTRGDVISDYKNFTVFHTSFLLLFAVATGEDWNMIMYDCSRTAPDCIPNETCGSYLGPVYFMAVILLVTYVMLNLFILVIIQQFEKLYLNQDGPLFKFNRDYEIIVKAWVRFTGKNGCVKLKGSQAQALLKTIPPPLGGSHLSDPQLNKLVLMMSFKSEGGWIYFNELLYRILRNQHVKFHLNKTMQIRELITQYKLFDITMSVVKMSKEQALIKFFRKVGSGGQDTVNPFLAHMYTSMSFLAWYQFMLSRERITRRDDGYDGSSDVKGGESGFIEQLHAIDVDIDHFSVYTVSSDEEAALQSQEDSDDLNSKMDIKYKQQFQKAKKTPMDIRSASKMRMSSYKEYEEKVEQPFNILRKSTKSKVNLYLSPETNVMIRSMTREPSKRKPPIRKASTKSDIAKLEEEFNAVKNKGQRIGRNSKQKLMKCGTETIQTMLPLSPLAIPQTQSQANSVTKTDKTIQTQGTPS